MLREYLTNTLDRLSGGGRKPVAYPELMEAVRADIAGTVEDEFADMIIRCLDLAGLVNLDLSELQDMLDFIENDKKTFNAYKLFDREFTEIAYELTDILIGEEKNLKKAVFTTISMILTWGDYLGIDMMWHIKQKMKYNETRPYKHGKRY